ncbi:alpha-hydroxy acid oxidase [Agrococcus sp. ARC_14]|uniref:alpha-hydroxy acid oxidase n=1 Tax=Agrococcus sp. ARC_14 TaxID=2919927 RepID=UPI001F064DA8|nr:alpha-hydroxy acid oxidase [Agrococcus sp. ARC_14]MCH1883987.1 alpha-hydroxy-acid oxidizing protein [Agrococcus sp. ARC_14]
MAIQSMFSVDEVQRRARRRLPKMVYDFVEGGALDERTLGRNRDAFAAVSLQQRILVDLAEISTATRVLGQEFATPIIVSPMGMLTVCHPAADVAVAAAAASAGSLFVHSPWSGVSIEEAHAAAEGRLWEQIAFWKTQDHTDEHLSRAHNLGVETIVVAGDVTLSSKRERDLRHGTSMPPKPPLRDVVDVSMHPGWVARWLTGRKMTYGTYSIDGRPIRMGEMARWMGDNNNRRASWDDVAALRRKWDGQLLVKGIMTPEDAQIALDHGADGVYVSNHGGRQFDAQPSTLDVLPAIAEAVNGRAAIVVDGGVRRGSDVVAALAAGADLVGAGRPFAYGLSAGGRDGVARVFEILADELETAMGFVAATGIPELAGRRRPVEKPTAPLREPSPAGRDTAG